MGLTTKDLENVAESVKAGIVGNLQADYRDMQRLFSSLNDRLSVVSAGVSAFKRSRVCVKRIFGGSHKLSGDFKIVDERRDAVTIHVVSEAQVSHEKQDTIVLPAGVYECWNLSEYDHFGIERIIEALK